MPTKIKLRFFGREDPLPTPAPKKRLRKDGWTDEQLQYLRDNWQTQSATEIGRAIGRTAAAVKKMGTGKMGLVKTPDAIRAVNKRNVNATQFKKGQMPHNTIYGDELVIRVRKNKDRRPYKYVRTGFRQWKVYHVWLWEQAHGPVPDGHIVVFRNCDQMDCQLANLELIRRDEHVKRNSGSTSLADRWVAHTIAPRDPQLKEELLKHPELIELKRNQLKLNRAINHERTGD